MAAKLTSYNAALGHLEQRRLASLTENREPRRVLDDYWDKVVAYCLARESWNFSYRAVQVDHDDAITPGFGYSYAFRIPDDWLRTRNLSASPNLTPPLLQFAEEAGFWYANVTPLFVQYNSNDVQYGMNLGAWPEPFADYVEKRLAALACKRITGSVELLQGPDGLLKAEHKARRVAASLCAMNEPIGFAPPGAWSQSRRGFGTLIGPGDSPTGGSLIG